jgi:Flp pilus assembly protein TadD
MTADSFVGSLCEAARVNDPQYRESYAFFIGAGCSVSSGIPASGPLVEKIWLPEWRRKEGKRGKNNMGLAEWAKGKLGEYDPKDPAASFGPVLEKRFVEGDVARQIEIERLCDGRLPGFGYWILASLMVSHPEHFNLVLTTNFDDLIADAVYLRSGSRPLVFSDAELAKSIRPDRQRKLVVKLHGDHRLAPRGTVPQIERLGAMEVPVRDLLKKCAGLIFIGYGGQDEGVLRLLEPLSHLCNKVYWCNGEKPRSALAEWLGSNNAHWVRARDFDELMLLAMDWFEFKHPSPDRFGRFHLDRYIRTYWKIGRKVGATAPLSGDKDSVKTPFHNTLKRLPGCEWKYLLPASWANAVEAKDILEQGIDEHDKSPDLHCAYGSLLWQTDQDRGTAERHLRIATGLDPEHIDSGVALALFLSKALEFNDGARKEFERLECLEPRDASFWARYAEFVERTSPNEEGYRQAEDHYRRALRADVYDAEALGLYASFLGRVRLDAERADRYFLDAVALDSANGVNLRNYAYFLADQGRSADAEHYYDRAMAVDELDPTTLGSFAAFLARARPDDPRIDAFVQTALDKDPKQKDAFELCRQAFESDPDDKRKRVRYAGALLGRGQIPEGRRILEPIVSLKADETEAIPRDLRAECWFLALVYLPERQEAAVPFLRGTFGEEPPLPGRTLRSHLEQARDFPPAKLLSDVAAVLVGTEDNPGILDEDDWWRRLTSFAAGASVPQLTENLEGCS